ncbi:MAG: SsrA-binding protein SmpB [Olsenella sp.]|jgi:SsrA-binding protein
MGKQGKPNIKVISRNRSASHNYFIDETFEAGIELAGSEVKSLRDRPAQLTDTFVLIRGGEVWLNGMHIHPYVNGGVWNRDPDRRRKLLLHKRQIFYLDQKLRQKGTAIVPLQMYFDEHNRVKLTIALVRGKKLYDKRADMAKRDTEREIQRALKARSR